MTPILYHTSYLNTFSFHFSAVHFTSNTLLKLPIFHTQLYYVGSFFTLGLRIRLCFSDSNSFCILLTVQATIPICLCFTCPKLSVQTSKTRHSLINCRIIQQITTVKVFWVFFISSSIKVQLTKHNQLIPWNFSVRQKIFHILRNPKVQDCIHYRPPFA
jgi:hypothetical protein